MVLIIEDGKVNNGHIVLSKPLSLPEGTEIRVQIELVDLTSVNGDDNQNTDSEESEDFANLSCFGMWADREDMRDSKHAALSYDSRIKSYSTVLSR